MKSLLPIKKTLPNPVPATSQASRLSMLQPKLTVNQPGDAYEREADAVADRIMRMPDSDGPERSTTGHAPDAVQRKCAHCEAEEKEEVHRKEAGGKTPPVTANVQETLRSPGRPLDQPTRSFMEPRFGHDFGSVRIHDDQTAHRAAHDIHARAYTSRENIVFAPGQFAPRTESGKKLLAHELTHVLQQRSSAGPAPDVQRDAFVGAGGKTAKDKDRPLTSVAGPLQGTASPGGTVIKNTASGSQNCAGDTCSISKFINWPYLGIEVPNVGSPNGADWSKAIDFVPSGCTRVNCSGINVNNTRCKPAELETIVFLYQWPVVVNVNGVPTMGTQSDFHMMGRDAGSLPSGWHSKMDRREKVVDIREPLQSLHDAYPHTLKPDRTIQQLCFCCDQASIKTA